MQKKFAIIVSFALSVLMLSPAFAQGGKQSVSGTVTAPNGDALVGASVIVKGSVARGVVVDVTGAYTIVASEGETLVYDCLGYVSKEVKVGKRKTIDVVLQEDAEFLQEILNTEEGAVLWHCSSGKDRCGTISAICLSLLGVDRKTVIDNVEEAVVEEIKVPEMDVMWTVVGNLLTDINMSGKDVDQSAENAQKEAEQLIKNMK
mgnify:CR=1 FL=1